MIVKVDYDGMCVKVRVLSDFRKSSEKVKFLILKLFVGCGGRKSRFLVIFLKNGKRHF